MYTQLADVTWIDCAPFPPPSPLPVLRLPGPHAAGARAAMATTISNSTLATMSRVEQADAGFSTRRPLARGDQSVALQRRADRVADELVRRRVQVMARGEIVAGGVERFARVDDAIAAGAKVLEQRTVQRRLARAPPPEIGLRRQDDDHRRRSALGHFVRETIEQARRHAKRLEPGVVDVADGDRLAIERRPQRVAEQLEEAHRG